MLIYMWHDSLNCQQKASNHANHTRHAISFQWHLNVSRHWSFKLRNLGRSARSAWVSDAATYHACQASAAHVLRVLWEGDNTISSQDTNPWLHREALLIQSSLHVQNEKRDEGRTITSAQKIIFQIFFFKSRQQDNSRIRVSMRAAAITMDTGLYFILPILLLPLVFLPNLSDFVLTLHWTRTKSNLLVRRFGYAPTWEHVNKCVGGGPPVSAAWLPRGQIF